MEYIFSVGFSVGFEGNNKYVKKVLRRRGTRSRCGFHFRYVTNKIVFTLLVDLARCDRHDFICNFAGTSCGLKQKEVNYLAVSSQRVQRSERRLNICKPSRERFANARITSLVGK